MCGRFFVNDDVAREIEKIVREISGQTRGGRIGGQAGMGEISDHAGAYGDFAGLYRAGDVYPSQSTVVLSGRGQGVTAEDMAWGFIAYDKKGLLINARAETVLERKTFRDSILHRRCIIPAKHFYEWDKAKNKVTFLRSDRPILYMAGFYRKYGGEDRFIIITTQANASVLKIHDRMPLILEEKEISDWICDDKFLEFALHKTMPMLDSYQEYEQQCLF